MTRLRRIHPKAARLAGCFAGLMLLATIRSATAGEALHPAIDRLVQATAAGKTLAPPADDRQFARRVYLDLAGRIPAYAELRKFVDNPAADRREKLIDELLNGPDYPRQMQERFSAMLLERRGDDSEWTKFLRSSFESNKPWDQLAREIIDPDHENEMTRGAAFFYTKRLSKVGQEETDYPGLTRDIGRLFLGMDLQCAQCHNHLFIDNYKQQDFQGLFIAFQNTSIRGDLKFPAISEKPIVTKLDFMSVFDKVPLSTGPRLPGGQEISIPQFEKGQEYLLPPDRKTNFPGVPKFSAIETLAHQMSTPQNRAFSDNIANRLWFVMLGRGLVMPLDQQHAGNSPSHPEVLAAIAQELVEHKFDMKWVLREIALSQTYQRSSILPAAAAAPPVQTYEVANEKRMSAEQVYWSMLVATGTRELNLIAPLLAAGAGEGGEKTPAADDAKDAVATATDPSRLQAAFVKAFSNPPQEPEVEFSPSLKAALFVLNDAAMLELLAPKPGNLLDRLGKLTDAKAVAEDLYLSVLSRLPNEAERAKVAEYLTAHAARREAALANLAWALLASTEFCINH